MLALVLCTFMVASSDDSRIAEAPDSPADPRARLSALRAEVDELRHELQLARQTEREEVATLARRKSEAETEALRIRAPLASVAARVDALNVSATSRAHDDDAQTVALLQLADRLVTVVERSIPVRIEERLRAARAARAACVPGPQKTARRASDPSAATQLAEAVRRELAFADQVEVAKAPVVVGDRTLLVTGARLGAALFLYEANGRAGALRAGVAAPTFFDDEEQVAAVRALVQQLSHDDKQGQIVIPGMLDLMPSSPGGAP